MLRQQKGKKQWEIAQICSLTRQAVSNYECGVRTPDLNTLYRLTRYYHISMDELFPADPDTDWS